jgi:hypothetical protein
MSEEERCQVISKLRLAEYVVNEVLFLGSPRQFPTVSSLALLEQWNSGLARILDIQTASG